MIDFLRTKRLNTCLIIHTNNHKKNVFSFKWSCVSYWRATIHHLVTSTHKNFTNSTQLFFDIKLQQIYIIRNVSRHTHSIVLIHLHTSAHTVVLLYTNLKHSTIYILPFPFAVPLGGVTGRPAFNPP